MLLDQLVTSLPFYFEKAFLPNGFCWASTDLQAIKSESKAFLHPEETVFLETLKFPQPQLSYLIGRYCAKKSIIKYGYPIKPQEVLIRPGVWGQPIIFAPGISNIAVSIAHSHKSGVAIAFPEAYPMGVDIEKIDLKNIYSLKTTLSSGEFCKLQKIYPKTEEILLATILWTLKEAVSKALRCGLTVPFPILETCEFKSINNLLFCDFNHFPQYRGVAYVFNDSVISIAYPKQLLLEENRFRYLLENQ